MDTYWSIDGEDFSFDSLVAAMDCMHPPKVGTVVYFGEASRPDHHTFICADDVIDAMQAQASDVGGEHADDYASVSDAEKKELEDLLHEWQDKHCTADFWSISDSKEYRITQSDIASWQDCNNATLAQEK